MIFLIKLCDNEYELTAANLSDGWVLNSNLGKSKRKYIEFDFIHVKFKSKLD